MQEGAEVTASLLIPDEAKDLRTRLMVCALTGEAGHHGREVTVQRLKRLWLYADKELHVTTEMKQTFQCMKNQGG
ncbi:unnamed protein product, partial [Choristocarpus tenellus]